MAQAPTQPLQTSVTQLDKFEDCPRDWWFDACARLPRGSRVYGMVFGDVLHGVIERYLKADAAGRDSAGNPVDLYPAGWQYAGQDMARIEEADEEVIRSLVQQAIDEGYLVRLPGRQVERKFMGVLVWKPEPLWLDADLAKVRNTFGPHIVITGKIDLAVPPGAIVDHKGTKSMRYALSEAKLADNNQLLLYAKVLADEHPEQEEFTLTHITYDRTAVKVRRTTATVTRGEINERFERLKALAVDMQALLSQDRAEGEWAKVPGAIDGKGAGPRRCSEFNGCRFLPICARSECGGGSDADQIKHFRRRYLRLAGVPIQPEESVTMGLKDKLAKLRGEIAAEPPKAIEEASLEEVKEALPDFPEEQAGPDFFPEIPFVPISEASAEVQRYLKAAGAPAELEVRVVKEPAVVVSTTAQRKQRKPCVKCEKPIEKGQDFAFEGEDGKRHLTCPVQKQYAPIVRDTAEAVVGDVKPDPRVRIFDGPRILHGCSIAKCTGGLPQVYTVPDALRLAVEEIAGNTLEEFYQADVWKRRDGLKQIGRKIADRLGGAYVLARPGAMDGDEIALVAAISPYSSLEIGAVA